MPPGQTAELKIKLVSQVKIIGGHYAYSLPISFAPDLKYHGEVNVKNILPYEFLWEARLLSSNYAAISNIVLPEGAEVMDVNESRTDITVRATSFNRTINLYYRRADMMKP